MKTCPICKAVAFDDADTCYGCLYSFSNGASDAPENPGAAGPREARRRKHAKRDDPPVGELVVYVPYEEDPYPLETTEIPYDYVPLDDEYALASSGTPTLSVMDAARSASAGPSGGGRRRARHAGALNLGALPATFEVSLFPKTNASGTVEWTCTIAATR